MKMLRLVVWGTPLMRRSWWTPGHFWTQPQSEVRLLWAFPVQLLRSPQMEIAWPPALNYFRYEKLSLYAQLSPVAVCAHCLLPPCTDLRTARSFSLTCPSAHPARGWHPNLRCLLLPDGWGFQPQQRSGSEMNGTRGMCWAVLEETLAAITTQRQRRNIFQVIFSVCHLSLPDSQGIFLLFCTIYQFGVSSHTLPHGLLWSCPPLPFTPFFCLSWAISGLHWGNLSEASRSLLKIAGPQMWHHCKTQPHKEGSRLTQGSPIWIQLLAYTADNKFLMYLILCTLQSEQVWVDWICSKGESSPVTYIQLDTSNKNSTGTESRYSLKTFIFVTNHLVAWRNV